MKKIFLSLSIFLVALSAFSQSNIQAFGSFVRNLNPEFGGNTYGAGIRIEFSRGTGLSKYFGLNYATAIITKQEIEARAFSNFTTPQTVPVTATYKLPMYRLEGGIRYYFVGEAEEYDGINFYMNLGVEACAVPNKPEYTSYDKENYTLGYTDDSDVNPEGTEKLSLNLMLAAGAGIEKNVGPGNMFLHIAFAFPTVSSQGPESIESFTPIPLNFNLGYKIPLHRSK